MTVALPSGIDLMRRLNDGDIKKAPVRDIEVVRQKIADNCEELLDMGARIRPLMAGNEQVGWVRGIHPSERRALKRWLKDQNDFILHTLMLATTFQKQELEDMTVIELRVLAEIVRQMSDYDMSLYPYLGAYVTTQSSENLWFGKNEKLTAYENRMVTLPDGKQMRIMAPPDHARMWASLCTYREQAKRRLEESFNALFVVRPWAGKSADSIQNELKGVARSLETDCMEAWETVVQSAKAVDVNDGWAHPGDSVEDLKREMDSMLSGDRHERLMEKWQKQMEDEALSKKQKIDDLRKKRGVEQEGIVEERIEVVTEGQMLERQKALKQGRLPGAVRQPEDFEQKDSTLERFKRYQ